MRVEQVAYEKELRVNASPATLFELLTDPDAYPTWMGFAGEFVAEPGGVFKLDFGVATVRGEFVEVVPNERVVFSWGWETETIPLAPGESRVEFTLVPDGSGTIVRMRHDGLTPAMRDFHAWGWDQYLERLALVAEGGTAGPDPMSDPPLEMIAEFAERWRTEA